MVQLVPVWQSLDRRQNDGVFLFLLLLLLYCATAATAVVHASRR
jgi:hypothetical protein